MSVLFNLGEIKKFFRVVGKKLRPLSKLEGMKVERESDKLFFEVYREVVTKLKSRAMCKFCLNPDEIVVRGLIPEDLLGEYFGASEPRWKFKLNKGWNNFGRKIREATFIAIQGFHIPKNCPITQIELMVDGAFRRRWNIEGKEGFVFMSNPKLMDSNAEIVLHFYSLKKKTVVFPFTGTVVEKLGLVVIN